MSATLYVILGSHACRTGMLLLEHKRIPYRTVTLPTGMHPVLLRVAGFAGADEPIREIDGKTLPSVGFVDKLGTVPALHMDGERVQTNVLISRHLDRVRTEWPLFPADPDERREVEEAERWGDEKLQMVARRLALAAGQRGDNPGEGGALGPILTKHALTRRGVIEFTARFFAVDRAAEEKMLGELPAMLDHIDTWIGAGTLNGDDLNAADYMIVSSLALLSYCPDIAPQIDSRPAGALVQRVFG